MLLITGSADQSAMLWNVQTGQQLFTFNFDSPARSVDFSVGDKLAVITADPFMGHTSTIQSRLLLRIQKIIGESALVIKGPQGRINRTVWGPLNRTIISVGEDTIVHVWDSKTGKLLIESEKEVGHKKTIISLTKSVDGSQFINGSLDKSAKVLCYLQLNDFSLETIWLKLLISVFGFLKIVDPLTACIVSAESLPSGKFGSRGYISGASSVTGEVSRSINLLDYVVFLDITDQLLLVLYMCRGCVFDLPFCLGFASA
ncbi:hypothetical protein CsatA_004548 [Cannabis sativa]